MIRRGGPAVRRRRRGAPAGRAPVLPALRRRPGSGHRVLGGRGPAVLLLVRRLRVDRRDHHHRRRGDRSRTATLNPCRSGPIWPTGPVSTGPRPRYDRARPGYPDAVFEDLFARLPARPTIVEVGPGTGQATRQLLARGARVTAVELGPAMADTAVGQPRRAGPRGTGVELRGRRSAGRQLRCRGCGHLLPLGPGRRPDHAAGSAAAPRRMARCDRHDPGRLASGSRLLGAHPGGVRAARPRPAARGSAGRRRSTAPPPRCCPRFGRRRRVHRRRAACATRSTRPTRRPVRASCTGPTPAGWPCPRRPVRRCSPTSAR